MGASCARTIGKTRLVGVGCDRWVITRDQVDLHTQISGIQLGRIFTHRQAMRYPRTVGAGRRALAGVADRDLANRPVIGLGRDRVALVRVGPVFPVQRITHDVRPGCERHCQRLFLRLW